MKKMLLIILTGLLCAQLHAQLMPVDEQNAVRQFPQISTVFNRVFNGSKLDSFYAKLAQLKKTGKGVVNIVHIGDSHIQADYLTAVVRNGLQQFFGSAGRGLVFPYQLAVSNAPPDISSSSNISWQFNRVAHPEIPITPGISGYTIRSGTPGASFDFSLKGQVIDNSFNRLRFFTDSSSSWILQADNNAAPFLIKPDDDDPGQAQTIQLEQKALSFTLSSLPSGNIKEFYGVSLENSGPGVLYHTIGVNGVRYDQFNISPLFWQQLPELKADLYIISLGTNEAQRAEFEPLSFLNGVSAFIEKLKKASPGASVLITTAADSYYRGRRPNNVLRGINIALFNYCNQQNIPIWDLYRISNGYGSSTRWIRRGLMNPDRIHFTGEGYRIQGQLLLAALAKGYNNYVNSY